MVIIYKWMSIVCSGMPISDHWESQQLNTTSGRMEISFQEMLPSIAWQSSFFPQGEGHSDILICPDTTIKLNVHVGPLFVKTSKKTQTVPLARTEPSLCQHFFREACFRQACCTLDSIQKSVKYLLKNANVFWEKTFFFSFSPGWY